MGCSGVLAADTVPGDIVNIGSGSPTRIIDLASRINALTGNPSPIRFAPRRSWDHVCCTGPATTRERASYLDLRRRSPWTRV